MSTVTADRILRVARSQIGYVEKGGPSGHDGNITKYWRRTDPALQGESWCADFVSWVFRKAGHPLPDIDRPYGYINCADAVAWAKSHGLWNSSGHYKPAWIILYCFDGSGVADHTGIVVTDDGRTIHTIEGNTSPTYGGDQANGGGVYAKVRLHDSTVLGCIDTDQWLDKPVPKKRLHLSRRTRANLNALANRLKRRKRGVNVGKDRRHLQSLRKFINRVLHRK